jgi:hypothetical protein
MAGVQRNGINTIPTVQDVVKLRIAVVLKFYLTNKSTVGQELYANSFPVWHYELL